MILWWLALAFVGGVAFPLAPPISLILVPLVAGSILAFFRRLSGLLLVAFGLGLLRLALSTPHDALAPYLDESVQARGVVATEPDIRDSGANYDIRLTAIHVSGRWETVAATVAVHTARSVLLRYGELVSVSGRLTALPAPYRSALARQGVTASLSYPRILDRGTQSNPFFSGLIALRQRIEAGIDEWMPEPQASLLVGIAIGTHSGDLGNLSSLLVLTGLIHIIAISGIKVAIVAGTVHALARRLPGRATALAASLIAVWSYVALTGLTVSGERSAVMWTLVFAAGYLGRNTVALVSLGVTAAVMVALQPPLLTDPSFQMSTLGTFGIVALTNPVLRAVRRLPSPLAESLAVTVAAQIATLPVVFASFHVLPAVSPIANALVLPLLPFLIVGGLALGLAAPLPALAAPLGVILGVLLQAVLALVHVLAALPTVNLAGIGPVASVLYYAVLAALAWLVLRHAGWAPAAQRPHAAREMVLGVAAALSLSLVSLAGARGASAPTLTLLGVGDALLLRSGGHLVLIDGAARPYQYLERLGSVVGLDRTIDAVIVTDPRATHIAGFDEVIRRYRVGEVLDVGSEYPSATYARWRDDVRSRQIPAYLVRTGTTLSLGTVTLTALGPDALYPNPRDCIALLRVRAGTQTLLIAGAASRREQLEALFRRVDLRAQFLVADTTNGVLPAFRRRVGGHLVAENEKQIHPPVTIPLR
ncbi:MAG TPA: ComEC/Rec2 family competence protein [Chloroflexota bacterium]|nr:ComEC/Rec2 family competence protein [Chloroflexota bacterium]